MPMTFMERSRAWLRGDHLPASGREWQAEDYLRRWARVCSDIGLGTERHGELSLPRLLNPSTMRRGVFSFDLVPAYGQSLEDITKQRARLTNSMRVWKILLRSTADESRARATIVLADPFVELIEWRHPDVDALSFGIAERLDGTTVPYGVGEDPPGMMVGGTRGFGKSSLLRDVIAGIVWLKAHARMPFVLSGVDMKHVELRPWGQAFEQIAEDQHTAAALLVRKAQEMNDRFIWLADEGKLNVWQTDRRHELEFIVIDEPQLLRDKAATEALEALATAGRAAGFVVLMATQSPQVKVVESITRDQLVARAACHCADWRHTDTVLGGWSQEAPAHTLERPGNFFMQTDGSMPQLSRAMWFPDSAIGPLVSRCGPIVTAPLRPTPPPPVPPGPPHPEGVGRGVHGVGGGPSGPVSSGAERARWAIRSGRPGGWRGHPLADGRGRLPPHRREHWERLGGRWTSEDGVTAEPAASECAGCGVSLDWVDVKVGAIPDTDGSTWQPGDLTASWCGRCVKG